MQPLVVKVDHVGRDRVEEAAVVRHDDERLLPAGEVLLEPEHRAEVEVVGRLIKFFFVFSRGSGGEREKRRRRRRKNSLLFFSLSFPFHLLTSSSSSRVGWMYSALAREIRILHPPEKSLVDLFCIA